jgi:hypothetical protein
LTKLHDATKIVVCKKPLVKLEIHSSNKQVVLSLNQLCTPETEFELGKLLKNSNRERTREGKRVESREPRD